MYSVLKAVIFQRNKIPRGKPARHSLKTNLLFRGKPRELNPLAVPIKPKLADQIFNP